MSVAVRSFDLTESQSNRLTEVAAPSRRHQARRATRRYVILAVAAVGVPFAAALVALGVTH